MMIPQKSLAHSFGRTRLLAGTAAIAIALSAAPARAECVDTSAGPVCSELVAMPIVTSLASPVDSGLVKASLADQGSASLLPIGLAANGSVVRTELDTGLRANGAVEPLVWVGAVGAGQSARNTGFAASADLAGGVSEIVNDRAIEGDVDTGAANDVFYQKVEGTVSGTVRMGAGDDTFWLEQRGNQLAALPAGGLEGGDGFDRFGIRLTESGTVNPASLPTGFERFALDLCGCDVVATIAEGTIAGGLDVTGSGTVTNLATIAYEGDGAALALNNGSGLPGQGLHFVNRGRIEATGQDSLVLVDAGYDSSLFGSFVNEGTVALGGNYTIGVGVGIFSFDPNGMQAGFVNRGEIIGSAAASTTVHLQGVGINEGVIRATGADSAGVSVGYSSILTNTASATISGTRTAIELLPGGRLTNSGVISGGSESGVTVEGSPFSSRATIVNEQGGVIRSSGGTAIRGIGDGQGVALANHGSLVGNVTLGEASDIVWLDQGSTLEGSLTMGGGDDTLMVSIDRFSTAGVLDTSGIVTGSVDMGAGNDKLWLRAGASGTHNVVSGPVANFEGGLVYEAAGENTELVLRGPLDAQGSERNFQGVMRLAGDGRIVVQSGFNNGGYDTQSIVVEANSSAGLFGQGGRGLDLVIATSVNGGTNGVQVDATYARRVELFENIGGIGFNGGTGLKTGAGTEVLLSSSTQIRKSGAVFGLLLDADYSDITNRTTLWEDSKTATADNVSTGVQMSGGTLRNERTALGVGRITVLGTGVLIDEGAEVINDGDIISSYANAIEVTGYGSTRIVNGARGKIVGHSQGYVKGLQGGAIQGGYGNETVENAGTITGSVALGDGKDAYIATGGTLTGDLDLGAGDDMLLLRDGAALNVTGTVTGGDGIDAYGRSFSQNGTFDLAANTIPQSFEMHGLEVFGPNVSVTVTSAQTEAHGLRVTGNGTVRNEASFSVPADSSGGYAGIEVQDASGVSRLDLVNTGNIVSAFDGIAAYDGLDSLTNSGNIEAQWYGVGIFATQGDHAVTFDNSGTITSHGMSAVRLYSDTAGQDGVALDFSNSGNLVQTGNFAEGLLIESYVGKALVENSGSISSSGDFSAGVNAETEAGLDLTNRGTIAASGRGGVGIRIQDSGAPIGSADCDDVQTVPQVTAHVANSGTIRSSGAGTATEGVYQLSAGLLAAPQRDNGIIEVENLAGGVIEATGANSTAVIVIGEDAGYGLTNVNQALQDFAASDLAGYGGGNVDAALHYFELDNAGTIRGGADIVLGADDPAYAGDSILSGLETTNGNRVIAGGIQTIDTTDHIVNRATGTIIGNVSLGAGNDVFESYGRLDGNLDLGSGDDSLVYAITSNFSGIAQGGAGVDTLVVDLNGQGSVNFDQLRGFENLSQRGSGSVTIRGTTDMQSLSIGGSNVTVAAGTTFDAQGDTVLLGSDQSERVTVGGTIGGAIALGGGSDVVTLEQNGLVQGAIDLGAGDDRLELQGGTATGTIDGGEGSDTVAFQISGTVNNLPNVINFESLDASGEGVLALAAQQDFDTITLRNGADLTLTAGATPHTVGSIVGDDSSQVVVIRAPLTGSVSLGGGDDRLDIEAQGTLSGALDGGAGNDTLDLNLTGAATIAGGIASFETINVNGATPLTLGATLVEGQTLNFDGNDNTLTVSGGSLLGLANGGAGNDTIVFDIAPDAISTLAGNNIVNFENLVGQGEGTLRITGNTTFQTVTAEGNLTLAEGASLTSGAIAMDGGRNVLTLESGATVHGAVDGGDGLDRLVLNQNAQQSRTLSSANVTGFEELESGGPGELVIDRDASFGVVDLVGGRMTVAAGRTLTVPVLAGGEGASHLAVFGTLAGNVDLGAGDDRLTVGGLGAVTGSRTGGAGVDTLDFSTGSTPSQLLAWDGTGFDSFERLNVSAGALLLTDDVSFQRVTVSGGGLYANAGTTIASDETIVVAQNAVFGSSGTVNADIEVRGTLAPGGTPGTMTVDGNVAFASGSRLALEVLPEGHDLLDISGTLTVANGAAIDITGALGSSRVGAAIDLVIADGGINGGFTTINKSQSVFGYVVTRGNRIQIVGSFQNSSNYPTNVQAAIAYSNSLLTNGQMVQAYTGILPLLTDAAGAIRPDGFARLTPEGYATALEASVDNGLAVTDALRAARLSAPAAPGWYGFAQGLSQWSRLGSDGLTGASAARSNSQGMIGGIGYASAEGARFGVYIGGIDTTQSVGRLGVDTKLEGVILGGFADVSLGDVAIHAAVAYDMSKARTSRTLRPDERLSSRYDLGGFIADAAVSYAFEYGDWSIRPQIGTTYVAGHRDQAREQGSEFALQVAKTSANAWFGDASLTVSHDGGKVQPYAEVGLRHRLGGTSVSASGRYAGLPQATGSMTVDGAEADRTTVRLGAGLVAKVAENVRLNLGYSAEFGDEARHNLKGGVSFSF